MMYTKLLSRYHNQRDKRTFPTRRSSDLQLHEMMERFDRLEERARTLKDTEHRADVVTHEIFERLNRTFITPLEREDIVALASRSEEHTSELQSRRDLVCRLLLEKKKKNC